MRAIAALVCAGLAAASCKMTPEEIQRIEVENELLRQEIQVMRENCDRYRYRDLELEVEEEDSP